MEGNIWLTQQNISLGFLYFNSLCIILLLQRRSEVITTYALCGFTNFLGLGVLLGGLGPMAPHRQGDMAKIAIRSLFAATIACFMTASIAGKCLDLVARISVRYPCHKT